MRCRVLGMAVALFLWTAIPSIATKTGLIIIPTAETVGKGMYSLELDVAGSVPDGTANNWVINSEFGIGDRFETGLDYASGPISRSGFLLNAKYNFLSDTRHYLSYAVGIFNQAPNGVASGYVVATRRTSNLGLHLGINGTGNAAWFAGFDRLLSKRLAITADYTSGSGNFSSTGFLYQASEYFNFTLGGEFPNGGGATEYILELTYTAPYTH